MKARKVIASVLIAGVIAGTGIGVLLDGWDGEGEALLWFSPTQTYTLNEAMNALVNAASAATYTLGEALNLMATGSRTTGYTPTEAANYIANNGANLVIPAANTNTAAVRVNGAWTALNTTVNYPGVATADTIKTHFPHLRMNRFMRDCTLNSVKIYLGQGTESNYTRVTVQIWRRYGGQRFIKVATTPNLLIGTGAGVRTVTLTTPISVRLGDYYMIYVRKTAAVVGGNLFAAVASSTANIREVANTNPTTPPGANGYLWYSATLGVASFNIEVEFYSNTPPQVIAIGYSHLEGQNIQYSYARDVSAANDTTSTLDPVLVTTAWEDEFFGTLRPGVTFENASYGGSTSSQIFARAPMRVYQRKPRMAILQFGGNDQPNSVYVQVALRQFRAYCDSLTARGIINVVVLPVTQSGMSDAWATSVDSLIAPMENIARDHGAIVIDPRWTMAAFRAGDPYGNRWGSIASLSVGDSLHWNATGQAAWANAINNGLKFDFTRP